LQAGNPGLDRVCHAAVSDLLTVASRRWFIIAYAGQDGRHTNFS
jgi:hypothetical protein